MIMFQNKILIFIILIIALLSISVASATESSINATDTVSTCDDSSTEVVTFTYDENTSLDVAPKDNIETSSQDVKTFNSISNENTLDEAKSSNTIFSNNDLISSSNPPTQNDIVANEETTPKTFTDLNKTITSNTNSTLKLDSNYKRVDGDNEITISKDITIDGNGFTIDANKLGNIFNVDKEYTLSLTNVTLANGKSNGNYGGAISNKGTLTLTNVIFVNNSATYGGGIYNNAGSGLSVSGCSFVNNSASSYGGAIFSFYSRFTVSNSVFVNNTANWGGNAIYSNGESLTINGNWWGTNNPIWDKLVNDRITHESYGVLSLTATSDNVAINFYKNGTTDVLKIPTRSLNLTIDNKEDLTEITDGTFKQDYAAPTGDYNVTVVVDNQKLAISFLNNVYVDPNGNDA